MGKIPLVLIAVLCLLPSCSPRGAAQQGRPDFITPNDKYYITRIGKVPEIDEEDYELTIKGIYFCRMVTGRESGSVRIVLAR